MLNSRFKQGCRFTVKKSVVLIALILLSIPIFADSSQVDVTATSIANCREGTTNAQGRLLQECRNGDWVTVVTCPQGQFAEPLSFTCQEDKIPGSENQGSFIGGLEILIIIVIILAAVYFLVRKRGRKSK